GFPFFFALSSSGLRSTIGIGSRNPLLGERGIPVRVPDRLISPRNPARHRRLFLRSKRARAGSGRAHPPSGEIALNRRNFILAAGMPLLARAAGRLAVPAQAASDAGSPFDPSVVRQLARDLAQKPFKPPDTTLPDNLKNLSY